MLGSVLLLLALLWLPGAFLTVDPGHRGVVQRFGRLVAHQLRIRSFRRAAGVDQTEWRAAETGGRDPTLRLDWTDWVA